MKKKIVCIIGAGISGLTAGALLVKNGYKVKIYEYLPFLLTASLKLGARALKVMGAPKAAAAYIFSRKS